MRFLRPEGVDFSDYMARVVAAVRRNWYAVMPESAQLGDRGRVCSAIPHHEEWRCADGEPVRLLGSGKEPLDRAAVSAIRSSNPFERCHRAFSGPYIELRFYSCIICPSKPLTSETPAPTGFWQSSPRTFLAHLSFCSRASSPGSMSENKVLLPLVAIVGPTASGKSALGVKLAEQLGGEVVACDSTQLYRALNIGTAKPIRPNATAFRTI